jgi:hypothetical protein
MTGESVRGESAVTDDVIESSVKLSELDKATSDACTRSGTFILLLAVLLLLLAAFWTKREKTEALASYVNGRNNLALYVDILENDEIWQRYKGVHPDADSMPLAQLLNERAVISKSSSTISSNAPKPDSASSAKPEDSKSNRHVPNPPQNLTATFAASLELYEVPHIVEFLGDLNNGGVLSRARQVSNFFDYSIVKWVNRRGVFMYANAVTGVCTTSVLEVPERADRSPYFVPRIDSQAMLNCLTLRDVRELAKFEAPVMSNPIQLGERIAPEVDLTPGSLPRDPLMASIVTQVLLLFVLGYFAGFAGEAASLDAFPAKGTLFGAFHRTRWALLIFGLALWTPTISAIAMTIASGKWGLVPCLFPIVFITFAIQRTLNRKSYFALLSEYITRVASRVKIFSAIINKTRTLEGELVDRQKIDRVI